MRSRRTLLALALLIATVAAGQARGATLQPSQVVLNWQSEPSTSMTITWRNDERDARHVLRYGLDPNMPAGEWYERVADSFSFEETSAWLHRVALEGLESSRTYHVVIDHPTQPESFTFRTLPATRGERDLVFLAGGDSRSRRDVRREMNALAAAEDPDFVIFAGDFINTALSERQWDDWFDDWHEQLITPAGRRIPVIPAIGNHEVAGAFLQPRGRAAFYYNRFALPSPGSHHVLRLGPDLVLLTLDSDHTEAIEDQTRWLDETLGAHDHFPWKLVQYHVAAWPSVRDFDGERPAKIRAHWVPLLEKHDVDLVIEAHDHAYKKTVPIRANRANAERGVIYIGDGGWGAPIREVRNPAEHWWLDEAASADHFWKLTLSRDGSSLEVEPIFRFEPEGTGFRLEKKPGERRGGSSAPAARVPGGRAISPAPAARRRDTHTGPAHLRYERTAPSRLSSDVPPGSSR